MAEQQAKVLLVDDDPDFVEATRIVLETQYQVIIAKEGDEGVKKAREENPDIIILDVIMPVKDGFSAAEQLKKDLEEEKHFRREFTAFVEEQEAIKSSFKGNALKLYQKLVDLRNKYK